MAFTLVTPTTSGRFSDRLQALKAATRAAKTSGHAAVYNDRGELVAKCVGVVRPRRGPRRKKWADGSVKAARCDVRPDVKR